MWSAFWYIVVFFGGLFVGLGMVAALHIKGDEDDAEEERTLGRLRLSKRKGREAQKGIEKFEEKYQVSFAEFEESIDPDEKLRDYAEWFFLLRTVEDAKQEIEEDRKFFP